MAERAIFKGVLILGLMATMAFGAELFKDDFSSCANSSQNWVSSSSTVQTSCANGSYIVTNSDPTYSGLVYHNFKTKPSTFTLSGKITRTADSVSAGFYICLGLDSKVTGYCVLLNRSPYITVDKIPASGNSSQIFMGSSTYLQPGTNELKVSKKGNSFFIFCNGHSAGSFTDASSPLSSGDMALAVTPKSTVTFDDILVTDQADTVETTIHKFSDDFDGSALGAGWVDYWSSSTKSEANGALRVSTLSSGAKSYLVTDIVIDNFVSKTIVSNRGGKTNAMYGFFLSGKLDAQGHVPMAQFAISGDRSHATYTYTDTIFSVATSTSIHGAPYVAGTDTTFFWDTIEVVKSANSCYKMIVNGDTLDSLAAAKVKFAVTGAGIFCDEGQVVAFNSFYARDLTVNVISPLRNKRLLNRIRFSPYEGPYVIDPLGRKVRFRDSYGRNSGPKLVPGFYLTPNGKSGIIVKSK